MSALHQSFTSSSCRPGSGWCVTGAGLLWASLMRAQCGTTDLWRLARSCACLQSSGMCLWPRYTQWTVLCGSPPGRSLATTGTDLRLHFLLLCAVETKVRGSEAGVKWNYQNQQRIGLTSIVFGALSLNLPFGNLAENMAEKLVLINGKHTM